MHLIIANNEQEGLINHHQTIVSRSCLLSESALRVQLPLQLPLCGLSLNIFSVTNYLSFVSFQIFERRPARQEKNNKTGGMAGSRPSSHRRRAGFGRTGGGWPRAAVPQFLRTARLLNRLCVSAVLH